VRSRNGQTHFQAALPDQGEKSGVFSNVIQCTDHESNVILLFLFVAHEYLQRKLQFNKLFTTLQITTLYATFVFPF
jgi:hypothetical protein